MPVLLDLFRVESARVADIAAAVQAGVAIQELVIEAGLGHADAVAAADDRRPVQHDDDPVSGVGGAADERDDARVVVVAVDPLEP